MIAVRVLLGAVGVALIAVGVYEVLPLVENLDYPAFSLAAWALGGTLVHDAILVPTVSLAALLLVRVLSPAWRAPVLLGGVLTGVLALVAVPLFWRTYEGADQPGLHGRDYLTGLLVYLAIIWTAVVIAGLLRTRRATR